MDIPSDYRYTSEHEWLDRADGQARVGVTAYAADALGDIVFVDLPEVGTTVAAGQACGELESTKSVSDLFAPADGEVTEINQAVVDDPALVNSDPYGAGWLFRMRVASAPDLLDADGYGKLVEG